jgi:hypothetical protein
LAIASSLMIWLSAWHPSLLFALAGASAVSCLARLRLQARTPSAELDRSTNATSGCGESSESAEIHPAP